jgi:disulfide bond formation protein DsbB
MNSIRDKLNHPLVAGLIGLAIGLILGLFFAWQVWPVEWANALPEHLSTYWKEEYTRMAVEAFSQNSDKQKAQERFEALGKDSETALESVIQNPDGLSTVFIDAFSNAVSFTISQESTPFPEATEEKKPSVTNILTIIIPIVCVLLFFFVAVVLYLFVFKGRIKQTGETTPAMEAETARRQADYTDFSSSGAEPPLAQFMASYKFGDDLFDDSFSIDSASGEFLGECGIGISEIIGVGDPKKVTAFEVWLFDKNDIQTVTKVIMSSHAFYDNTIHQRLVAKGEPVLAEPSCEVVLETQTLQLVAKVVDMSYGEGSMPKESYFNQLLLELAVWSK